MAPVTAAIDGAFRRGDITARHREKLYRALFYLLMGEPTVQPLLIDFCQHARRGRALERLYQAMGYRVKLPQALYSRHVSSMSIKNVQEAWGIATTDLALVSRIAKEAQVDPQDEHHLLRRDYSPGDLDWLPQVELEHEEVEVILQSQALEDMLLGALETYKVPKSKKEPFSEVFGLCLGMASHHVTVKRGKGTRVKWFVYVEKAVPQIRAKASQSSVTPNAQSLKALVETSSSLFPQLEIIGDYHSHPYKSYHQLKSFRGWSASREDALSTQYLYRDLRTKTRRHHRMRVSFVIAIAKGRGTAVSDHMRGRPNVFHLNMAGCHLFIAAYRILSSGHMTDHGVVLRRPYRDTYLKAG